MADPHVDQRLAAILVADVAGYSRLMEADERATVATLDAYRAAFQERVTAHGGRIVDTAGDSVLARSAPGPSMTSGGQSVTPLMNSLQPNAETTSSMQNIPSKPDVL